MVRKRSGQRALPVWRRARITQDRQGNCSRAAHPRHRTPGNGCGRGPKSKGKAETASRNKNVSGAADSGESRDGGTRAVSNTDPCYIEFRRPPGGAELPLARRPHREARVSRGRAFGNARGAHAARDPADRRREGGQPAFAKRETEVCRRSVDMTPKRQ